MTGVSKRSTGPRTTVPTSTVPASVSRAVRTAVLWVPDWPVVAAMAAGQAEVHQSVAVHDGRRITAVSALARTQGVRRGMRRRQAQECCPELVLLTVDEGRDARTFEQVAASVETVLAGLEVARVPDHFTTSEVSTPLARSSPTVTS